MLAFDELPTDLQDVLADWPARRAVSRREDAMTHTENRTNTTIDWGQLHEELARPFPDAAIKYRVGAVSKDKKKAQALPFIDSRTVEDRLNDLVPGAWSVTFDPWGADRIICRLTIHGITRSSTGDGAGSPDQVAGTAAEAQAFKRAASRFGLGRYLYGFPVAWVDYDPERRAIKSLTSRRSHDTAASPLPRALGLSHKVTGDDRVTLGPVRAAGMSHAMSRLGLASEAHLGAAERVLGHPVGSLASITESDARQVWAHVRGAIAR